MTAAALMAAQQAQFKQQMVEQSAMSMQNSRQEHQQQLAAKQNESQRALANDQTKRANEAQADAAAVLKDTTQKLDSSSGA
ncbi:hypothetical protein ACVIHI_009110 [Bradyrhizobium sp. USDA 4524]|uniref:hypothetical protein n=1 Tax=unclassified Bradyrhizobium TaxID=2631580 RepID=UPI00209D3DD6|nr:MULTISPECIES: hypothetical protein [unclassified Bradyrhizobium]MCP1846111.1 hypothetical protein [Bradyrhizobium sp. USDA 4538]MCP1907254.1 hypothetical protein [Bradyrhizobium sp. USDA 4537]MCP1985730.1 hypothetical protein [Bradyrhizobium sp. USDA 4539]